MEQLGSHLAVARIRRGESLRSWAKRMGVSVPTLQRLEAGDPGVGLGILATALFLMGRDGALSELAAPEQDRTALDQDVRKAIELGRARALAATEARLARTRKEAGAPTKRGGR